MFVDVIEMWEKRNVDDYLSMLKWLGQKVVCVAKCNIKKPLWEKKRGIEIIYVPYGVESSSFGFLRLDDFNDVRGFVSSHMKKVIFGFESFPKRDSLMQRSSGLNRIICKEMNKRNNIYGLCLKDLFRAKQKDVFLGRVMQNLYLCNKYKVKAIVFSFASSPYELIPEKELRSLMNNLSPNQGFAKQSVEALYELLGV